MVKPRELFEIQVSLDGRVGVSEIWKENIDRNNFDIDNNAL